MAKIKIKNSSPAQLLLYLQLIALSWGAFVGWSTIFREVEYFCELEGDGLYSLTDFTGTITKNPLLTPCFWGSIAFIVAIVWTIVILRTNMKEKAQKLKQLLWLLVGGTIFALVNNIPIFYKYLDNPAGEVGCTIDKVSSPFLTSCFFGFSAFFSATIFGLVALQKLKKTKN